MHGAPVTRRNSKTKIISKRSANQASDRHNTKVEADAFGDFEFVGPRVQQRGCHVQRNPLGKAALRGGVGSGWVSISASDGACTGVRDGAMARVEVITGRQRRRRWTEEQKRAIVAESFAP